MILALMKPLMMVDGLTAFQALSTQLQTSAWVARPHPPRRRVSMKALRPSTLPTPCECAA